jgi:hypothetical protein
MNGVAPRQVGAAGLFVRKLGVSPMDEAHTLRFLGWTVGGIVGVVFLLNAIALSFI